MARPVTMVPMMARLIMSIASWKTSGLSDRRGRATDAEIELNRRQQHRPTAIVPPAPENQA